ncbi:valacyclovir hydrolase [Anabrus simplex]|uniref:valacyclovir hydrolase n=1 Tax=Anabrus simplex TaxID=316456 RepID=UPI0035A33A95
MVRLVLSRYKHAYKLLKSVKTASANTLLRYQYYCSAAQEQKLLVDGCNINYVKVGAGPHPVLCTPGALGSIWTDLKPQVENLDRTKFTIVAWDPPGYGKSRPPSRDFSPGFCERDAEWAVKLMQALDIPKYSLLGWSNGGIASMIAAAKYPDRVKKLVVWGSNSYVTKPEIMLYAAYRDIDSLSPEIVASKLAVYGEDTFKKLWVDWIDGSIAVYHSETKGDICKQMLPLIQCPTLVIQGSKDMNVAPEHPQYIAKHIPGCRLLVMKDGKHNLHLKY